MPIISLMNVPVYLLVFIMYDNCRGSQVQPKNQLLVLRCMANMFSLDNGQRLMDSQRKWVSV